MRELILFSFALLFLSLVSVSALHTVALFTPLKPRSLRNHSRRFNTPSDKGEATAATERHDVSQISRRKLIRTGAFWTVATGIYCGSGTIPSALAYTGKIRSSSGRLVDQVEPDERKTYMEAQNGPGGTHKRILWVGPSTMNGVFKNLFQDGNDVVALDLLKPDVTDLNAATEYATSHGYQLQFEQGDATNMKFTDESFDVVVSSMFLCQDFDPEVVVSEIRRVLKPGGRFGWYEHVEDIDGVIVEKVFGERSVIRVQAYPEQTNVVAGVVFK